MLFCFSTYTRHNMDFHSCEKLKMNQNEPKQSNANHNEQAGRKANI